MLSASVVGVGAVKSQAFGIPAGAQQRMACENISMRVCKCVSVFVSVCVAVSGAVVYCRQSICSSPPHTHTHTHVFVCIPCICIKLRRCARRSHSAVTVGHPSVVQSTRLRLSRYR